MALKSEIAALPLRTLLIGFFFHSLLMQQLVLCDNDLETDIFSKECARTEKIFFEGECYGLLTKASCSEGEWLVLDSESLKLGQLNAVCAPKRCRNRKIYWPETDSCYPFNSTTDLCTSPGTVLKISFFGNGVCDCIESPPHVRMNCYPDRCYPLYSRGPCSRWCSVREKQYGFGVCAPNLCAWGTGSFNPENWLLSEEDGRCYRRNSTGPCEQHERFDVHPKLRKPACVNDVEVANLVGNIPSICQTDYNDECTEDDVTVDKTKEDYKRKVLLAGLLERDKSKTED